MTRRTRLPQGSVFRPIIFLVHTNDTDDGLCCKILKFVDDTKLGSKGTTEIENLQLQVDLDKLINWAHNWQINFNVDVYKVWHTGSESEKTSYRMNHWGVT